MTRRDLQELSRMRQREAKSLLDAGHYAGAYYIGGYAVECALKAIVARQIDRFQFPDKKFANECFTHDLEKLVGLGGINAVFTAARNANPALATNWTVVKDWKEDKRYDSSITLVQATGFLHACSQRSSGVLSWLRTQW